MPSTANGNGVHGKVPAGAEPRYVLVDPAGENYRGWTGEIPVEHWEGFEEELVAYATQPETDAVAHWLRWHDLSYWRSAPHPRDAMPPTPPPAEQPPARSPRGRLGKGPKRR